MTLQASLNRVQRLLSSDQLRALADLVEPHAAPPHALGTVLEGASVGTAAAVQQLRAAWERAPTLTGTGLALALPTAADAAEQIGWRRARPVRTGAAAQGNQRLTAGTLHELVAGAQERILLVSFAAHTLASVAADLRAAVQRGVIVNALFETTEDGAGRCRTTTISHLVRSTAFSAGAGRGRDGTGGTAACEGARDRRPPRARR